MMCSLHYHARIILWRKSAESRANPIMSRLMLMTLMACLRTQVGCCFIACEVCIYIYSYAICSYDKYSKKNITIRIL